jgi:hypothetical protein
MIRPGMTSASFREGRLLEVKLAPMLTVPEIRWVIGAGLTTVSIGLLTGVWQAAKKIKLRLARDLKCIARNYAVFAMPFTSISSSRNLLTDFAVFLKGQVFVGGCDHGSSSSGSLGLYGMGLTKCSLKRWFRSHVGHLFFLAWVLEGRFVRLGPSGCFY